MCVRVCVCVCARACVCVCVCVCVAGRDETALHVHLNDIARAHDERAGLGVRFLWQDARVGDGFVHRVANLQQIIDCAH
jgi:hypothetical protein